MSALTEDVYYSHVLQDYRRKWAAFEVGLVLARQNGKNVVLEARELAGLFLWGERLIIHSAHQFDTSAEAFRRVLQRIESTPDLDKEVFRVARSHGSEGIELKTGQRLQFRTRTSSGGRGWTDVDCLVLDEAMILESRAVGALLPTMSAQPNPQVIYTGSAGTKDSTQLGRVRARGIRGDDPRLCYMEWSINPHTDFCTSDCEEHDSTDTEASYAKANPGYGIRLSLEHIESERRSMDEETFSRERLSVGTWPVEASQYAVISEESWMAREDPNSEIVGDFVLSIDTTPDLAFSCISACGRNEDGATHVEVTGSVDDNLHDHRPGIQWVVPRVLAICSRHSPKAVVIDKAGQAGMFVEELESHGIVVLSPTAREYAQSCGEFYSAVVPRKGNVPTLVHKNQRPLTNAVAGAEKRDLAAMWAWDKRTSSVDISPLVSSTNAMWGCKKLLFEPKAVMPWVIRR
jgi:hypothetical protein